MTPHLDRILSFVLLLGCLSGYSREWGKEQAVVEAFIPQKILLTAGAIDSLLNLPLTLNDCIAIALKNNLQLQIDRLEYNRVYQSKRGSIQNYLPTLGLSAERSKLAELDSLNRETERVLADQLNLSLAEKMPLGGSVQFSHRLLKNTDRTARLSDEPAALWTISFSQPLLKGFGYAIAYSGVKLADLDYQIERYRLEDAILNTIFLVKAAYVEVIRQKKVVSATEAAIERDKILMEVSKAKVEAKLATRRDVLSAEIILQRDFAELVNVQARYQDALDALKNQLGIDIQREISLAITDLEFEPIRVEEENWLNIALENNRAIKTQKMLLQRKNFETKLARNNRLPELSVEGGYSRRYDEDPGDERSSNIFGRLVLSYPILNLASKTDYQRAVLAEQQFARELEDLRRLMIVSIRNSARNLQKAEERLKILLKNIEAAREKVTFATTMFNMGKASNLDITDAQEALLEAEVNYVDELADYYVEQARLEQILGGHPIMNQK